MKPLRLIPISLVALALTACGGTPIRTFEASGTIGGPLRSLMVVLHHGNLTVKGSPDAGMTVSATLVVKDRGLIGALSATNTNPDAYKVSVSDNGTTLRIGTGTDEDSMGFDFDLTVTVPSDYLFYSSSAQDPSTISTSAGTVAVSDLTGNMFEIEGSSDLAGRTYPVSVTRVGGILLAVSSGNLTIRNCSQVMMAEAAEVLDISISRHPVTMLPMLFGGKGVTVRVPTGRTSASSMKSPTKAMFL
jgi:hypothetical protein